MTVGRGRRERRKVAAGRTGVAVGVGSVLAMAALAVPVGGAGAATFTGSNFAGYVFTNSPTSAVARFKVPAPTCTSTGGQLNAEVQLQGPFGSGGHYVDAVLGWMCVAGRSGFFGNFGIGQIGGGTQTPWSFTPAAGDVLSMSVSTPGGTSYSLSVTDVTSGKTSALSGSCTACGGTSGVVSVSGLPVPAFGALTWSSVKVNGAALAAATPKGYKEVNGTHLLIKTSPISSSGRSFTNTFVASS